MNAIHSSSVYLSKIVERMKSEKTTEFMKSMMNFFSSIFSVIIIYTPEQTLRISPIKLTLIFNLFEDSK